MYQTIHFTQWFPRKRRVKVVSRRYLARTKKRPYPWPRKHRKCLEWKWLASEETCGHASRGQKEYGLNDDCLQVTKPQVDIICAAFNVAWLVYACQFSAISLIVSACSLSEATPLVRCMAFSRCLICSRTARTVSIKSASTIVWQIAAS